MKEHFRDISRDGKAMNITITDAGSVDTEPRQIKIFSMKYFDDAEPKLSEVGTFMWPEKNSLLISPLENDTEYFARSFPVDNSDLELINTINVSFHSDIEVRAFVLTSFRRRYFHLY